MLSDSQLQRFRDLLAADTEMNVVGDWFTLSMSLTSGDDRCIVRFERGVTGTNVPVEVLDCALIRQLALQVGCHRLRSEHHP